MNYASTKQEKELLTELLGSNLFSNKEYPIQDAEVAVIGEGEEFTVDLLWKKSRAVYLSRDNEEACPYFEKSGWVCLTASRNMSPEAFAKVLKERQGK